MYGEKLHSYGVNVKSGGAQAPSALPLFLPVYCLKMFAKLMQNSCDTFLKQ